jgi:hypothetical protein
MSNETISTEEQTEPGADNVINSPQAAEIVADELHVSVEAVEAGEAPAQEASTILPEPAIIHEDTPMQEEALEVIPEPIQAPVEESNGVPGPTGDADLVGHDGPLAGYVVAHDTLLNVDSTMQPAEVIAAFQLPEQSVPKPNSFDEYIHDITIKGTPAEQSVVSVVDMYMSKMRPRMPTNIAEGCAAQVMLWRALLNTIQRNPGEFRSMWSLWLMYFNHYNTSIFGLAYAFRFMEFVQLPKNQIVAFQRILNLLMRTADPINRAAIMRHISLEATMSVYFTEADRQRVIGFYKERM